MKDRFREKHLNLRKSLNYEDRETANRDIQEKLKKHPDIKSSRNIMVYASTSYEVETYSLIGFLLARGKKVYLPVVSRSNLKVARIDKTDKMVSGRFGIAEPPLANRRYIDPGILDVIIVPGVCFTKDGHRIGRGEGYYDRFLSKISGNIKIIGVCYSVQLEDDIPYTETDVKVDEVVTENSEAESVKRKT